MGNIELFAGLSNLSPEVESGFENPVLLDRVRSVSYGDILLNEWEFPGLGHRSLAGRFVEDESGTMRRTREDSRRAQQADSSGMLFGQLVIVSESDNEAVEAVVVKSFDTAREAVHEHVVMTYLNGLAPPPRAHSSFRPLGFYAFPGTTETGLVTSYDETVISYDNLFLNPDREPTQPQVEKAMTNCGLSLGYLNARGINYRDAQIKNNAAGNGGVRHVDPESAESMVEIDGSVDPERAVVKIAASISVLFRSLRRGGDYTDTIRDTFIPVYEGMVNQPYSRLPIEARLRADDILPLLEI